MAKLRMEFLGGYRVTLDGAPVTGFESNKVRALLAYLATEAHRPHPRESLATRLWPDWPDSAALSNLRYALSDLRKVIGDRTVEPPFLIISREAIQFNPECDYRLDVAEFLRMIEAQDVEKLERAAALYQGEFLEGFSVGEAAPFEDWARLKREQLHRAYMAALHRLAEALERCGERERALMYARKQVEVEAWDESAQRQVMRLLALCGRRGEALEQFEALRKALEAELGAMPSTETVGLIEQIREGGLEEIKLRIAIPRELPAVLEAAERSKMPVFVAREDELRQLDLLLERSLAGKGQIAFITGGAGRGKTALLREFAWQACLAHPDLLTAAGNCNPYSGVSDPYLPLRGVLRSLMGDVELARSLGILTQAHLKGLWRSGSQAMQVLAEHGCYLIDSFIPGTELLSLAEQMGVDYPGLKRLVEQAANKPASMAQQNIFEQYCAVLRALSREHPLLILLDDLQWADSASAGLLYHLGTRLEDCRILVLGAYRPEEVAVGRGGERHPLEKALAESKRLYGDSGLDLTQRDEYKGRGFINAYLDSEPNKLGEDFREQLHRHTEGHALFTIELLRAMQERGELVRDKLGCWVETAVLDWESLPGRVEAVIAERIGRLEAELRQTLSIASVEGEDFTAQVTARVKEVSERQLLGELSQELEKRHRLVREQGEVQVARQTLSRYRFAHALYQQYLYNHMGAPERRLLHRATAEVLEALYEGNLASIAPQLAFHWGQARDVEKTREYMLLAGQAALGAYANQDAERYFHRVLELGPSDVQRAAALGGLGEALRLQARRNEAAQVLREGIELYRWLGDMDMMARLYCELSYALWRINYRDAWRSCNEGLDRLKGAPDSKGLAGLLAEAGRTSFFLNEVAAESLCLRAYEMANRLGLLDWQVDATITLALIYGEGYGDFNRERKMLEQVILTCENHGLWRSAARAHLNISEGLNYYFTDIHSAINHLHQGVNLSIRTANMDMLFNALLSLAYLAIGLGNLSTLESMLVDFLQNSPASKEQIEQFLQEISKHSTFYKGEFVQALEFYRAELEDRRKRQIFQGIANQNLWLAMTQIDLARLEGSGDLAEAESALLENLEVGKFVFEYKTRLVQVYSMQNRFSEAHALLVELSKAPVKYRLQAKSVHAIAEGRWGQAASITRSLIELDQNRGYRWEQARALIDLGDIYTNRDKPGDQERARDAYQQSLEMFSAMGASGYVRVLEERLERLAEMGYQQASA